VYSATIESKNLKFGTEPGSGSSMSKTAFKAKIGINLG